MNLNYQQTLDAVENFMNETGIRKHCTEVCKGACCSGCYDKSKHACYNNEGRRLACSSYICEPYGDMHVIRRILREGSLSIRDVIHGIYHASYRETGLYSNIYFKTPPKELFTLF